MLTITQKEGTKQVAVAGGSVSRGNRSGAGESRMLQTSAVLIKKGE